MSSVTIDYERDWAGRLRGRIFRQFRGSNIEDIAVDVLAPQIQALEDSAQSLLTLLDIDNSVGAQLQLIGRIVGQPPTGETDDVYRLRLKARIKVNLSSGTPEDMYAVFLTMLGLQGTGYAKVSREFSDIATMTFRVFNPVLDPIVAALLFGMLFDASVDGVRLILEWPSSIGGAFDFDVGLGWGDTADITTGGALAGALGS